MSNGQEKIVSQISVYCHPRLKQLAEDAAESKDIPLNELVTLALARFLRAPRELHMVPKKRMGRPRKKATA
jgi:hypothetical protein